MSDGETWTQATPAAGWTGRNNFKSVVLDDKIWVMGGYDGQNRNDVWYSTGVTGVTEARKARGLVHAPTTLVARSGNYSCSSRTELYDSDGKLAAVLQVGQNGLNVSPGVYFAVSKQGGTSSRLIVTP